MIINSEDYHDYVIKDGKLIGEFEQMYQKAKGIPWHQDEQRNWIDVRLEVELLREYAPFDYIHDFACGTGHYLSILADSLGAKDCVRVGLDISETACERAKTLFPNNIFATYDLMSKPSTENCFEIPGTPRSPLFSFRGTLWYVFPKIENVVQNIANHLNAGELLLVSHNFPPLESKFVGKEVLPNPDAVVKWFSSCFELEKSIWMRNPKSSGNDNWLIALFRKLPQ